MKNPASSPATISAFLVMLCISMATACGSGQHMDLPDAPVIPGGGSGGLGSSNALTYDGQIQALFQNKCSACHNSHSSIPNWLSYGEAYTYRKQIYQRIVVDKSMPLPPYDKAMTDADRKEIGDWINSGAPEIPLPPPTPGSSPVPGGSPTPAPTTGYALTYADVSPILEKRCLTCHSSGGEAGTLWNWGNYDPVYRFQSDIYSWVVVKKYMPADNNKTGMTQQERDTLGKWIQAGAPSGDLPPIQPGTVVSYSRDIQPIFSNRCALCHDQDHDPAIPNLLSYEAARKITKQISKRLFDYQDMPPANNLTGMTLEEKDRVKSWIKSGAQK